MAEQLKGLVARMRSAASARRSPRRVRRKRFAKRTSMRCCCSRARRAPRRPRGSWWCRRCGAELEFEEVLPAHQGRDGRGGRPTSGSRRSTSCSPACLLGPRKALRAARDHRPHLRAAHQSAAHRCARSATAPFRPETVARAMLGAARARRARRLPLHLRGQSASSRRSARAQPIAAQSAKKKPA